jgi:hypothetical protein
MERGRRSIRRYRSTRSEATPPASPLEACGLHDDSGRAAFVAERHLCSSAVSVSAGTGPARRKGSLSGPSRPALRRPAEDGHRCLRVHRPTRPGHRPLRVSVPAITARAAPSSVPATSQRGRLAHHLSGLNGQRAAGGPGGVAGPQPGRTFVVVRELKRHLIGYAWIIALRELLRIPQIPVEVRRGAVILAGLLTGPFVISALIWWILTGKHPPCRFGNWVGDPAVVRVNTFRSEGIGVIETAGSRCGLNGSMHHRGRVKIVIASGPSAPVEEWATACRVAPVEI